MSFSDSPLGSCHYAGLPTSTTLTNNYIINAGDTYRQVTPRTITNATDEGFIGEICWDVDYIYICVATDTWQRVAHATW